MTLRIEAGDSVIAISRRERLREPTGSPVGKIALDDLPEDLARALIELRQDGGRHGDGAFQRHGRLLLADVSSAGGCRKPAAWWRNLRESRFRRLEVTFRSRPMRPSDAPPTRCAR